MAVALDCLHYILRRFGLTKFETEAMILLCRSNFLFYEFYFKIKIWPWNLFRLIVAKELSKRIPELTPDECQLFKLYLKEFANQSSKFSSKERENADSKGASRRDSWIKAASNVHAYIADKVHLRESEIEDKIAKNAILCVQFNTQP